MSFAPVPPSELPHGLSRPSDAVVEAAMRLVPVALEESAYAGPAFLARDSSDRAMHYHAWLEFARVKGVGRAAAEWAIIELAQRGLIAIDRAQFWKSGDPQLENQYLLDWQRRVRGELDQPAVDAWDLTEIGRVLRFTSAPCLWRWHREDTAAPVPPELDWGARAVGYLASGTVTTITALYNKLGSEGYPGSRTSVYSLPGVRAVAAGAGIMQPRKNVKSGRVPHGSKSKESGIVEAVQADESR